MDCGSSGNWCTSVRIGRYICIASSRRRLQSADTASASHLPTLIACLHEARRVYASPAVARRLYQLDRRCEAAPLPLPPRPSLAVSGAAEPTPHRPRRSRVPPCTPKRRCGWFAGSKWSSLIRLRQSKPYCERASNTHMQVSWWSVVEQDNSRATGVTIGEHWSR